MPSSSPPEFPTTHWSLVIRAGGDRPSIRREALDELLRRYMRPLRTYLIRARRLPAERADDLLQAFVLSQMLEKDLLAGADQGKGTFRAFLVSALNRFVASDARHASRLKRGGGATASLDGQADPVNPAGGPGLTLEVEWACAVLNEAVARFERECAADFRQDLWGMFQARVLGPTMEGKEPVPYPDLVKRFEFKNPAQAANVLMTAKRMFARCLRATVGEYAGDEAEIEAEIADLQAAVGRPRPDRGPADDKPCAYPE